MAMVCCLQIKDAALFDAVVAQANVSASSKRGLVSALGWVSAHSLKGMGAALLSRREPFLVEMGIAACEAHRVDPGSALDSAIASPDASLRARALRSIGELGRQDLLAACIRQLEDPDPYCAFWAGWSAIALGDRGPAVESVARMCMVPGPCRARALQSIVRTLDGPKALALVRALAQDPVNDRVVIRAVGVAGDPAGLPWLIDRMDDPATARIAGESFSLATGVDLARLELEKAQPEDVEPGATEDPDDDNVAVDEDEGLPWPDRAKVAAWWQSNSHRFPAGRRFFMGEQPNIDNCSRVLCHGYQRQRIAAAEHLCLLKPGTKLFPTRAPAWRQQRWLDAMGA